MEATLFALLLLVAAAIGFVASLLGVGGGIAIVPVLVLSGLAPSTQVAVGTSLAVVIATGIASSFQYLRQRVVDVRLALVLVPTLILGAELGVRATGLVSSGTLAALFGVFALYPAALMLTGRKASELAQRRPARSVQELDAELQRPWTFMEGLLVGLGSGVASALFGIGGGSVMVPAMVLVLRVPMLTAVATSLFAMVPTAAFGTWRHWAHGNVMPELAFPMVLGVLVGAQLGPRVAARMPQKRLRQAFGVALVFAALNLIVEGLL